jgi:ABC-type antimicrobial peptide transport system permease subunit
MFGYALKRILRGRGIFLALFLSVALAATLFSGILQAADAVGASLLNKTLKATDVDIVSSAENRNLTRTSLEEVEDAIGGIENVVGVEHLIRSVELESGMGIEVNLTGLNASIPFTIVAIAGNSSLVDGITGVERLELGMLYVEEGSVNASLFRPSDTVTLSVSTYIYGGDLTDIQKRYVSFEVGSIVEVDDRLFSIAMGRYSLFLRSVVMGTGETGRRSPHQLIIMSEETLLYWLHQIYAEGRRHTRPLIAEVIIGLDRGRLLNPWDITGSSQQVKLAFDRVNSIGAQYGYVPVNYLGDLLDSVSTLSSSMKTSTILVAVPVFFTAWYLGLTVSDISFNLRRREIGLLFTRGLTHGQVFYIFLFEALLVSLMAGVAGILGGASIILLIIPEMGALHVFRSVSPITAAASFVFSSSIALLAVYRPAKNAVDQNIVDALREYQSEEEDTASWHEPALALLLGTYRVAILLLGITVEQFRPTTTNIVIFILYSTWWGVDFILTYIAPILFFWGFTKLFIQHVPWIHDLLGSLARSSVGDIAVFSTLSARRDVRRTVASTFMAALILGYGVSVIGGLARTDDFTERFTRLTVGADASVWLFDGADADGLRDEIASLDSVASAMVVTWFEADSSLGVIQVRVVDPLEWRDIGYFEDGWLGEADAFERMNSLEATAIMERGAAALIGVEVDFPVVIKLGTKIHTFTVVGLYGQELGPSWTPQNPTMYIPATYLEKINKKYILLRRILVRFEEGAEGARFADEIEAIDPFIEGVDIAEELIKEVSSNIVLTGPRRVEELGVYFSALVSSLGVILVTSTAMRSRWKELTMMAIRGFSTGQLVLSLMVENIGIVILAVTLGLGIGSIMLMGETEVINVTVPAVLQRRVVFPASAQLSLVVIVGLLVLSTVAPILLSVRQVSEHPIWRTEE